MRDSAAFRLRLNDYLRAQGLKHTRQREAILDEFVDAGEHISLDELLAKVQQKMPGVGYATVYRSMKLFVEAGLAHERKFGDGQTRYEAARVGDPHHDHIICVRCGRIFEFEDEVIEERQDAIAARFGMTIVSHRLDIWGQCADPNACGAHEREDRGGEE